LRVAIGIDVTGNGIQRALRGADFGADTRRRASQPGNGRCKPGIGMCLEIGRKICHERWLLLGRARSAGEKHHEKHASYEKARPTMWPGAPVTSVMLTLFAP